MPIIPIIAAVVIAALLAGGGLALSEHLKSRPSKVALVGRRRAGKSTFVHFLQHGNVPDSPLPVTGQQRRERTTLGKSQILLIDSGGDPARLLDWEAAIAGSDYVLYFFDASKVIAEERSVLAEIEADVKHLRRWREGRDGDTTFILVGSHADKCWGNDLARVDTHPLIIRLKDATDTRNRSVVIGSLVDKDAAGALSEQMMGRMGAGK